MSENYRIEDNTLIFNEGVTSITSKDLHNWDKVKIPSIIIPNSVTEIGSYAFENRC